MPKIVKNGKEYSGIPTEVVTAWQPTGDPVQVAEPLMGNTDISSIGDGTVTGAVSSLSVGLNDFKLVRVSIKVTLPDGTTSSTNTTVDLSSYVPSGYIIWGYSTPTVGTYSLPYIPSGEPKTYVFSFDAQGKTMTITNRASAWNNYTLWFTLFLV